VLRVRRERPRGRRAALPAREFFSPICHVKMFFALRVVGAFFPYFARQVSLFGVSLKY
jgi:hypothetical protein